jgi:predicted helicase
MLENYVSNVDNFKSFAEIIKHLTNADKGFIFEELTKCIFMFHPYHINVTKNIWLLKDVPISIIRQLNIPIRDKGIDLIMQTNDNKFYAIQSKFRYDENAKITWTDLGTFAGLAFGVGNGFSGGFFVTDVIDIDDTLAKSTKIMTICGEFFDDLDKTFFDSIRSFYSIPVENKNIITPRKHQINAIGKAIEYFEKNDRGYIEVACGGGKTLTSYWISQMLNSRLTIIAVPSLYLLSQFLKEWGNQLIMENRKMDFILSCSDADYDDEDFTNNGILMTTNYKEIIMKTLSTISNGHIRIDGKEYYSYNITIITTYNSSKNVIDALNYLKLKPDLCIFDEAHRTVGELNKSFSILLHDDKIKINKRLFMTATPKYYDGDGDDELVVSMNDKKYYGEGFFKYNTYDAIKDNNLCDYQIITMFVNDSYVKNFVESNKYVQSDEIVKSESHYLATAIMLLNAIKNKESHHLITYHSKLAKIVKFKKILDSLVKYFNINVSIHYMNGKMSINTRNKIFKEFNTNEMAILCTVRVLNEGVNMPVIDSECFLDPRRSTIDIVQCVGRTLRHHKDKKIAKIYVPIMINDINNIDNSTLYGNLVKILKAMNTTDTGIVEYFRLIKSGKKTDRKIISYVNNIMITEKSYEIIDTDKWIETVNYTLWKKVKGRKYLTGDLRQWVIEMGRLPIQKIYDENNERTLEAQYADKCSRMRKKYFHSDKYGPITKEEIEYAESIPGWYWKENDPFEANVNKLKKYVLETGTLPSKHSKDPEERLLGDWAMKQKVARKIDPKIKTDRKPLSDDKIRMLENVPGWYWDEYDLFFKTANRYIEFTDEYDKLPTPKDNEELAIWANNQRRNYKKPNYFDEKQLEIMNKIPGWFWTKDDKIIVGRRKSKKNNDDNDDLDI